MSLPHCNTAYAGTFFYKILRIITAKDRLDRFTRYTITLQ